MRHRLLWLAAALLLLPSAPRARAAEEPATTTVDIQAVGGLRFDPPRFAVTPGAKVKVNIENVDDMAHNFVLLQPGTRQAVVEAAMLIPVTPDADFVPKTDKVLQHSPLLNPSKKATVTFTAPTQEGVYPYVCTFPGHGLIMYGAMYVTRKPMPPFATDENLPEIVRDAGSLTKLHAYAPEPPYLYRNFLRDSGPASIAVCLPNGQNYCWDAGACRLRYVWSGAFLDPTPHWAGNGDAFAEVRGRIWYRATAPVPLRLGNKDKGGSVQFRGYRLVNGFPEFRYTLDGVEIHELIKPLHHGSGVEQTFTIAQPINSNLVYTFDPQGGATVTASAGTAFNLGAIIIPPADAKSFTVTLTEIPGREPLRYWSMNDTLNRRKIGLIDNGVSGRAASFDGVKAEFDTGIHTGQLAKGATFAAWVRPGAKPKAGEAVVLGTATEAGYFMLGWNLAGAPGFGLYASSSGNAGASQVAQISTEQPPDKQWHHLAFTAADGTFTLYLDGAKVGTAQGQLPAQAELFFGSMGSAKFSAVQMDEARLDDRAWSPAEIAILFQRERSQVSTQPIE